MAVDLYVVADFGRVVLRIGGRDGGREQPLHVMGREEEGRMAFKVDDEYGAAVVVRMREGPVIETCSVKDTVRFAKGRKRKG